MFIGGPPGPTSLFSSPLEYNPIDQEEKKTDASADAPGLINGGPVKFNLFGKSGGERPSTVLAKGLINDATKASSAIQGSFKKATAYFIPPKNDRNSSSDKSFSLAAQHLSPSYGSLSSLTQRPLGAEDVNSER